MEERMYYELVPIKLIEPNSLNPRKDYTKNTKEIQDRIKEHGWETAITCYQHNGKYVILSGHRRWHAGAELGETQIPVFVVPRPETEIEELERLASSQGGQIDWSAYEWARYTFDLWNLKGGSQGCSYKELAMKLGVSERLIYKRLHVFRYYKHTEIETQLKESTLTISILSEAAHWIDKVVKKHPSIVDEINLSSIKSAMILKAERKCFSSVHLRVDKFYEVASLKEITNFILDNKLTLKKAYELSVGEEVATGKSQGSKLRQTINMLQQRQDEIYQIDAENVKDAKELLDMLDDLEIQLNSKLEEVNAVALV